MNHPEETAPARLRALPSRLINLAAMPAGRLTNRALTTAGSYRYHYALLAALDEFGPASQASLGRRTRIDRSDMVATVNELAERGMVERSPDPSDRRRNVITITPAGTRHLEELDHLVAGVQDEFLAPLSPEERTQLVHLLTRIVEYHAQAGTTHT